jgi:hypothetical protein
VKYKDIISGAQQELAEEMIRRAYLAQKRKMAEEARYRTARDKRIKKVRDTLGGH